MDFSDSATHHEEMMRDIALRRAASHAPDLPATGECYWCGGGVPHGYRFCDKDCRDDFEKLARANK